MIPLGPPEAGPGGTIESIVSTLGSVFFHQIFPLTSQECGLKINSLKSSDNLVMNAMERPINKIKYPSRQALAMDI